jgi:hypothetical protein
MVYDHSRRPEPQNNSTNFDLTPSPNARKVRPHPQIEQRQEIQRQHQELGITPVEPSRVARVSPEKYKMSPEMHQETIRPGGVNAELMPLQARIDFLRANPDQNLSLNKISAAKAGPQTQTPQRIAQATAGQSANPVAQFQQDLNRNALTRIQNNRDRLNQSELRYRETDPKRNPNWANLDAQAEIVEDLRHREQNAKDALKGVYDKAIGRGGVPMVPAAFKDIDSNPEESRELILQFYQQVTGPNWKKLEPQFTRYANELYLATKIKHAMYETEPALAVVSAEYMDQLPPTTPQNTRKIQQVMTEGFAPMRDSMGKLEQAIRGDKSGNTAFELDRVVEGTLADIKDPQQRQKVAEWAEQKRKQQKDQQWWGNALTGLSVLGGAGAGLLGFARTAWVLGGTATALFGATTLQELRQTGLVLDGAQGQGPGNKSLTSADVNQVQTEYYSNYVNVAFLLVEGGMTVKSVVGLLQERRALETLAKLTPVERGEFAQAAQLQQAGKTVEAEGRLQQIEKQAGEEVYKKLKKYLRSLPSSPEAGMVHLGKESQLPKRLKTPSGNPIPYGFNDFEEYKSFAKLLRSEAPEGTTVLFQGSSVTGRSYKTREDFDVGRLSDFDIALANQSLFNKAKKLGYRAKDGVRIGPLKDEQLRDLGLIEYAKKVRKSAGKRPTEFMLFDSSESAYARPSIEVLLEEEGL